MIYWALGYWVGEVERNLGRKLDSVCSWGYIISVRWLRENRGNKGGGTDDHERNDTD